MTAAPGGAPRHSRRGTQRGLTRRQIDLWEHHESSVRYERLAASPIVRRQCGLKQGYTRNQARTYAAELRKETGMRIAAYKCPHCKRFHIGTERKG